MNVLAVIVAAVVNMILGALWYSPALFGKRWMELMGFKPEQMQERMRGAGRAYALMFIGSLITAYILSRFLGMMQVAAAGKGAAVGFLAWLGFVATAVGANYLFEGRPWSLYSINVGYTLVALVIMGAVLGAWR